MIKEKEEDWGGLDLCGLGEVRVGWCGSLLTCFFCVTIFFIAGFFALQLFCVLRGVLELCWECV